MNGQKGPLLAQGRAAELFAWGDDHVLKLFRNNHWAAAEQEAQIARLAYANGVRTPRVYEVIESQGRPGIVFDRIQGSSFLSVLVHPTLAHVALGASLRRVARHVASSVNANIASSTDGVTS